MVGEPFRWATIGANDIDIGVSVIVSAKSDLSAVGRELGKHLLALWRAEFACQPPFPRDRPEVSGVDKYYTVRRNIGEPEHPRIGNICLLCLRENPLQQQTQENCR